MRNLAVDEFQRFIDVPLVDMGLLLSRRYAGGF